MEAITAGGIKEAKLKQKTKDFELRKAIVEVLGSNGLQRVCLAGKAGIGKTRLAKMVAEHAISTGDCFLTICVHLNKKYVDELSLFENIASQLCVYSDFEETEVDDRDEDEDEVKKPKEVLDDLKKKISKEIEKKREAAEKEKVAAADKKKKEEDKAVNSAKETGNKHTTSAGKENQNVGGTNPTKDEKKGTSFTGNPYLLLILDDEGIKVTSEDEDASEDKDTSEKKDTNEAKKVTNEDGEISQEKMPSEDREISQEKVPSGVEEPTKEKVPRVVGVTSEERVMKDLNLDKFLREHSFLKDGSRLKILVTKRNGDEKPTQSDKKTESEEGNKDNENESEDNANDENNDRIESEDDDKEGKEDNKAESDGDIKADDKKNVGNPDTHPADNTQRINPDVVTKPNEDQSDVFVKIVDDDNLKELLKSLITVEWKPDEEWISKMVENSKSTPAAIFVLAKSLKQIIPRLSSKITIEDIKEKIKEVLSADRQGSSINPILHLAYLLLEYYDDRLKEAILDCFWHSLDFFEHCGCVYYRDLITQWILEGYFDPVRSVEKAYEDGHLILMELINRGMLKIQENNVVVPERAMSNLIDPRRDGLFKRSRLRFSKVYCGNKKKGLGKISQIDDMIKTVQAKKSDKMTTILVSGDRLRRVTPEKYFAKLDGLEVLGMFEPTLEPFVPALLKGVEKRLKTLDKLRVLVIRDCDLLDDIEGLQVLQDLQALEISGASCLTKISDDFFKSMPKLQSLHLSGLQITSSPSSITLLKKLHCLIIKDCPLLKDLPDIQELRELEVVDISGAHGLQTCFDNTPGNKKNKSKNKNFYHLTKLQLLDFSESQIERLPIFQDSAEGKPLHSVTRLLLRNCRKLRRLPSLKPLSGLQILDLSGTTSLVEMLEVCFEEKRELKSLNLSGTNLSELATTIDELTGLTNLLLKDCANLDVIPDISKLERLEVIDVSGSSKLHTIEGSFEKMPYLREVNLFKTQVKTPELPTKSKIVCQKSITLTDGTFIKGKDWNEVKAQMPNQGSGEGSSSDAVVNSEEITETKSEEASSSNAVVRSEIQSNEPRTSVCTENGDVTKERLLQVPIERTLYRKTLDYFKPASQPEIMEINETNVIDEAALANVEFISFMDCSSKRLTSIFNKTKSVKGCWLRMCTDIKDLFSAVVEVHPAVVEVHPAVDVERLELLETLSITNLPLLESISGGGSLKNLKKLTIECCPKVKTLFPEASQVPSSLKYLNVKYCEKLKKVAEGVELSDYTSPEGEENSVDSDWVVLDHSDADAPPQG